LSAAQATLMMTLCRLMPPRVMTLDVFVPVAPAEHHAVTMSAAQAILKMTLCMAANVPFSHKHA
jgi:hypothetical protein